MMTMATTLRVTMTRIITMMIIPIMPTMGMPMVQVRHSVGRISRDIWRPAINRTSVLRSLWLGCPTTSLEMRVRILVLA